MNNKIYYIELISLNNDCFRVYNSDITEFKIETHEIEIEDMFYKQEVIKEMLLVINDYDDMKDIDNCGEFDVDSSDICEIRIVYFNEKEVSYLVSMTHDDYNRGQMNRLDGNKLFISIRDESENILED